MRGFGQGSVLSWPRAHILSRNDQIEFVTAIGRTAKAVRISGCAGFLPLPRQTVPGSGHGRKRLGMGERLTRFHLLQGNTIVEELLHMRPPDHGKLFKALPNS